MNEALQRQIDAQLETLEIKPNSILLLRVDVASYIPEGFCAQLQSLIKERFGIETIVLQTSLDCKLELIDLSSLK